MGEYTLHGADNGVYILTFRGHGEHRINPDSMIAILDALDEVQSDSNATALITTNEGKFYSNGLDLHYLQNNPERLEDCLMLFHKLLRKFLSFPIPTFAAICGHAAAGGCILALSHDYRFLRSDRGFVFLNEVEIQIVPTAGVVSLVRSKLPSRTFQKAFLSGQKYSGQNGVEAGLVDASLPDSSSTLQETIKRAHDIAAKKLDRNTYKLLKAQMFEKELAKLESTTGFVAKL